MINTSKSWGGKKPKYILRNPHKYMGDVDNVIFRSTWEANVFKFCDNNPNIIGWQAEEIIIQYMKPIFNAHGGLSTKIANYYPDLYVEYVNKQGELIKELMEIKPKNQTRASRAKKYTTVLFENMAYMVNMAKWDAAKRWCEPRGIKFCIVTEDSIFGS